LLMPALGKDDVWHRLPDSELATLDPTVTAKYLAKPTTGKKSASPVKP
jgi:hypothetical protein